MTREDELKVAHYLRRQVEKLEKKENYPVIKEQVERLRETIGELEAGE